MPLLPLAHPWSAASRPSASAFALAAALAPTVLLVACDETAKSEPTDLGAASLRDLGGSFGGGNGGDLPGTGGQGGQGGQGGAGGHGGPGGEMPGGQGGGTRDAAPPVGGAPVPGDAASGPDAAGDRGVSDDAGVSPHDGGPTPEPDARPLADALGPDAFPDAPCVETEGHLMTNGDFELWGATGPEGWGGAETNLPEENVALEDTAPRCGASAVHLANRNDGHKRYTQGVANMRAGRHTLAYWVRGHGEIRNAWFGDDYSNYVPAGYLTVDSARWQRVTYSFTVDVDRAAGFEIVFSLRNTQADPDGQYDDLQVDDVSLVRLPGLCDDVVCEAWSDCDGQTGQCVPRFDRCADDAGCSDWAACDADHRCVARPARCGDDTDCAATPEASLCELEAHTCVPGDPCAGVMCLGWQRCSAGACVPDPARCRTSADCLGGLPVCDSAAAACVEIGAAANLVRNGGFEDWNVRPIPFHGEPLVPDFWYGLDTPNDTEIDPDALVPLDGGHSGARACQIVFPGMPADRFVTEPFNLPAGGFTCGYWVRGHGNLRHRWYSSGGLSPAADAFDVDTDTWTPVHFAVPGGLRDLRLIFYASNTLPDRGHLQLDDVMCTRNP